MKAKDYAERFKKEMSDDEFTRVLYDTLVDFLKEGQEILESRGNGDAIIAGVLREMDLKWQSLARKVPDIKRYGYRDFMMREMPSVKLALGW